jgi:Outer membrane protein beta-barrel domain
LKHLIRVFWVLGTLAIPVATQAHPSVGVRAGVNLASLTSDLAPPFELETASGFVGGAFVTLPVNHVLAFQPEALYSRQGTKYTYQDVKFRTELDYIQVPLLARVRTGVHSPLTVLVGPSLGIRTHASSHSDLHSPGFVSGPDEVFKRFDLGLTTGAAFDVGHLVFDGRYTWGMTNMVKDTFGGEPTIDNQKNRVFSFSAGVRF